MGFTTAIKTCFKKSFSIKGCAPRSEYWWFTAFFYLVMILMFVILGALDATEDVMTTFIIILFLAFLPASFCVTIRRLHDQNDSGWYILLGMIPYIGGLIMLVLMLTGSDPDSRFLPKEENAGANMPEL